ncbi:MAG TPA: diaminopimelate epimerase [Feifaniaceae bacterium]|nr:diaminopimelate epimerase [Feifaniaceae bacterium]
MRFAKVHGLGNDFLLIDAVQAPKRDYNAIAPVLCHRQTGVGADGLLLALPSSVCDVQMRIVNGDGSEAEMCGNGIRAFAKYVYERGLVKKKAFTVETLAGVIRPQLLLDEGGSVTGVRVDMGKPLFDCADVPASGTGECLNRRLTALGREFIVSSVRMGVPHTAVMVDDPKTFDLRTYGPAIERHEMFPQRTNVNFFRVIDHNNIEMRTWERGAGATLACGTGCSGTAALCAKNGLVGRSVDVHLELGKLHIDWAEDGTVYMTGPAEIVFEADFPEEKL